MNDEELAAFEQQERSATTSADVEECSYCGNTVEECVVRLAYDQYAGEGFVSVDGCEEAHDAVELEASGPEDLATEYVRAEHSDIPEE